MIETKRCHLRLPQVADVDAIINFFINNKEYLEKWDPLKPANFYTQNYWKKKVQDVQDEFKSEKSLGLHVFLKENGRLIGMINFGRFERGVFQCCGLGHRIDGNYQGLGLMTEALTGAIDYIFKELNFHRIEANYIPSNTASARVLEKLGFKQEGLATNYLQIAGIWQDHVLNSLQNKSWKAF